MGREWSVLLSQKMIGIFPVWVCSLEIYTWWPAKNKVNSSLKLSSRSFWYTSMTSWGERHSGEKWSVIANWEEEEKYWIMTYRAYGNKLTNRPCLGTEATNRWVFKGKTLDQSDFGAVGSTHSLPSSEIFWCYWARVFKLLTGYIVWNDAWRIDLTTLEIDFR